MPKRIIRKYDNRRLYDTGESRYITLADIRALVLKGVDFLAVDKARKDVTREVLLQVIVERERAGKPAVSRDHLIRLIRSGRSKKRAGNR